MKNNETTIVSRYYTNRGKNDAVLFISLFIFPFYGFIYLLMGFVFEITKINTEFILLTMGCFALPIWVYFYARNLAKIRIINQQFHIKKPFVSKKIICDVDCLTGYKSKFIHYVDFTIKRNGLEEKITLSFRTKQEVKETEELFKNILKNKSPE